MKNKTKKVIDTIISPLQKFIHIEAAGGILLLFTAIIALFVANMDSTKFLYSNFINTPVNIGIGAFSLNKSLLLLVNDGLMAIFFFLVGLEIKREILVGELATIKKASFSIFAAIGGMLIPAFIYFYFNKSGSGLNGWAIPMATDIAFALGIVSLLGDRVPRSLKVFLLALAIIDDLGAILIIALFYSSHISLGYIAIAGSLLFAFYILNKHGYRNIVINLLVGFIIWFCFLKSGIHATIAGVLVALLIPATAINSEEVDGDILDGHIHSLHPWVAFLIMPIFAFFNAGVLIEGLSFKALVDNDIFIGIFFGLVIGKPLGVFGVAFLACKLKLSSLPRGMNWLQVTSIGCIAGIGFTMSLFISGLAFQDEGIEIFSKAGILVASFVSLIIGYLALKLSLGLKTAKA